MTMNKKTFMLSICMICVLAITFIVPATAHAERYPPYKWTIVSSTYEKTVNKGTLELFDEDTATRNGEKLSFHASDTRTGSLSGELKVSYATLTARLEFGYKNSFTVGKSKTTPELKKGTKVKAYFQAKNAMYKVEQKGVSTGRPTLYKTVYVYKPLNPTITLKYS